MTDAIKAMELLEVAEKWLEPFGVTDPFSKSLMEQTFSFYLLDISLTYYL
jgi:hypothetical protein